MAHPGQHEQPGDSPKIGFAGCLTVALLLASVLAFPRPSRARAEDDRASDPRSAEELLRSGRELLRARDYQAALPLLEEAVALEPQNLDASMARVTALRMLGLHDDARASLTEALTRFPKSQEPVVSLGYLDRALGRLDESVRWFQRGAEMEGGWYNHIRLAVSYTDLGDMDRMAEAARQLEESPYGEALGQTLEHLFRSEFDSALEIIEAQLESHDDEMWRSFAAALAVVVGDDSQALLHYRALVPELFDPQVAVKPSNASEAIWLAFALQRSGQEARAAELARAVLEVLEPTESAYELPLRKVYRSAAHLLLGDRDSALAEFRSAVDHGYRSILFERIVRFEEFEMFAPLRDRAEFRNMLTEIRDDNARMRERLRSAEIDGADCPVTRSRELVKVLAPVAGEAPVWVWTNAFIAEAHPEERIQPIAPSKVVWLVRRNRPGDLVVTGRRWSDSERLLFMDGPGAEPTDELTILDAHEQGMLPGGADAEILETYAFRGSYVVYPGPGCWELTARLDGAEVTTVHRVQRWQDSEGG